MVAKARRRQRIKMNLPSHVCSTILIFQGRWIFFPGYSYLFGVTAAVVWGLARISILLILTYLPIGPIFGLEFGYRTLLLVPFFAMLAAELLK